MLYFLIKYLYSISLCHFCIPNFTILLCHQLPPYIQVTVAGNTITVGYIGYDIVMDIEPEVIIGVVVVIVIIIAAIIAGAILYRRHKIKMRKDRERNMMRGFELVPERKLST